MDRLEALVSLLSTWSRRINLVAPSTIADAWERHILDSAQLAPLAPDAERWIDLGSGAGFPGLVVAALRADRGQTQPLILVESDVRKAAFLREAAREMALTVDIRISRIEDLGRGAPGDCDVVSARALAPLSALLGHAAPLLAPGGVCLFPKGRAAETEVDEARRSWQFTLHRFPSATSAESTVLAVRDLARA